MRNIKMAYFEDLDGAPERAGKVIGDALAIVVIVFVIVLLVNRLAF
jgi:hypothetical protein